jgi:hypothetical protein
MFLMRAGRIQASFCHHLVLVKRAEITNPTLDVFLVRFQSHSAEQGLSRSSIRSWRPDWFSSWSWLYCSAMLPPPTLVSRVSISSLSVSKPPCVLLVLFLTGRIQRLSVSKFLLCLVISQSHLKDV